MVSTQTKTVLDLDRSTLEKMLKGMPDPWIANFTFYGPLTTAGIYGMEIKDLQISLPEIANLSYKPVSGHRINYNLDNPTNKAVIELILKLKSNKEIKLFSDPLNFGMVIWSNDNRKGQTTLYSDHTRINLESDKVLYTKPMMNFAEVAYAAGLPVILNDQEFTK